jgi:hypothetical protein
MVVPSLKDLEFDAPAVSRWFPTWHVSQVCGDRPYPFFRSLNDGGWGAHIDAQASRRGGRLHRQGHEALRRHAAEIRDSDF